MNSKIKIIIAVLILLLGAVIYVDYTKPAPINWNETYDVRDKSPFGLYVFKQESNILLQRNKIIKVNQTPYEFLEPQYDYDSLVQNYKCKGTLFFIADHFTIDDESTQEMLYFEI